ncbi:MAG: hypothetical protein LC720_05960 [Actinobacteria bacterium]|nr:hypothetical protein [Actinomycetota bacterium]
MPKIEISRLVAAAAAAVLCLGPGLAAPALAASHHKSHAKRLTLKVAQATALKSASPLILDPADQVRVSGCTPVSGHGYSCGLELRAAHSASVCNWTVVVKMTRNVADVATYSHIDCAG